MTVRAQFTSCFGFILAAAGSAVGLGNIWGFPTQAAQNGGGAFLLVYLILVFILAYPLLVAELLIGRHGQSNPLAALRRVTSVHSMRPIAFVIGGFAVIGIALILSFYAIVAGWLVGYMLAPLASLLGFTEGAAWLMQSSKARNGILMLLFMLLTACVVRRGVNGGIEKYCTRLMPLLFLLLCSMSGYILTQPGAIDGLRLYLVPDFSRLLEVKLLINAMGQAFFSLSIGVGAMMAYGSYLSKSENLPQAAAHVALLDTAVAFLAGLLILPAMFVAQQQGIAIYDNQQQLLCADTLVFQVFPALFDSMGSVGPWLAMPFFGLLIIAALTSTIAMLEVPVLCITEEAGYRRGPTTWGVTTLISVVSSVIICNFKTLFSGVVTLTTQYMQPLLGLAFALFVGWVWHRDTCLQEIRSGYPNLENSLFWKIWPWYLRFVCPLLIGMVFIAAG